MKQKKRVYPQAYHLNTTVFIFPFSLCLCAGIFLYSCNHMETQFCILLFSVNLKQMFSKWLHSLQDDS